MSVAVSVVLKIAKKNSIRVDVAVAFNYVSCSLLTFLVLKPKAPTSSAELDWWLILLLGFLLPTIFIVMGRAVRMAGIALSDAAQRLSLIISVAASFLIFGQSAGALKIAGIVLAIVALAMLSYQSGGGSSQGRGGSWPLVIFLVWAGYGTIDVLLKFLSKTNYMFSLSLIFVMAFVLMGAHLLFNRIKPNIQGVVGGLILGCFNFANIWFYLEAHRSMHDDPALVYTAMNVGVIVVGSLVGVLFFKERLNKVNWAGLALSIVAITTLSYFA